ncbi:MAG: alpha-N-acetylgalactosaminidase [Flavobacteriaceae bacterium]|nr:alpha-N-acetylgalactosaminidase [Flavobacteriaceae bacterium]|tara:strand:- start:13258 stop:14694 length:1437 start_codon:yes stop_codon:yes gene_type:complete
MKNYSRRKFLKTSSLSAASAVAVSGLINNSCKDQNISDSLGKYMGGYAAPKLKNIRVAFIGLGYRGTGHLSYFGGLPGTEVVAISDLYQDNIERSHALLIEKYGKERFTDIKKYWGDENKWKKMLKENKPDIVFISTNWINHAPMAIKSMENNAHAFVEVPMATTIEDMWKIVNMSEKKQKHCMMLENVNYFRAEMMFLNMIRQNFIGELQHAEAAYIHDLRGQMNQEDRGTGSWRTLHYANSKGNLYPTHGLGPVAQYMNLARTEDTFKSIVSYSSPSMGRKLYAEKNYPKNHKWNKLDYQNGDLNTSIIKTQLGRTILVQWDETSPRPYSRINLIQGTKGVLSGHDLYTGKENKHNNPVRIALDGGVDGITDSSHSWVSGKNLQEIIEKYDHPFWKRLKNSAKGSDHGGSDGIMLSRIAECLHNGIPLDQNVYEGCFWSSVTPLTAKSIEQNGAPQLFPDFTRGNWKTTKPLEIVS